MCGAREEGRWVSLNSTAFWLVYVLLNLSLRIGFERAGGGIFVVWVVCCAWWMWGDCVWVKGCAGGGVGSCSRRGSECIIIIIVVLGTLIESQVAKCED